jgi:hypothetical protein
MFPKMYPDLGAPAPRDQTVMKQAAELLEEALREVGGSLDEIGHNPLFAKPEGRLGAPTLVDPSEARPSDQSGDTLMMNAGPEGLAPSASGPVAAVAASPRAQSDRPASTSRDASRPPTAPASPAVAQLANPATPAKKGGHGVLIALLLLLGATAGGGVFAWKSGLLAKFITRRSGVPSASLVPSSPPSSATIDASTGGAVPDAATPPDRTAVVVADAAVELDLDSPDAGGVDAAALSADASVEAGSAASASPATPRPRPRPRPRPPAATATATATATGDPSPPPDPAPAPPPEE